MASEAPSLTTTGLKVLGAVGSARVKRPPNLPGSASETRGDGGKGWVTVGAGLRLLQPMEMHTESNARIRTRRIIASFPQLFERDVEDGIFLPTVVIEVPPLGFIHGEPFRFHGLPQQIS